MEPPARERGIGGRPVSHAGLGLAGGLALAGRATAATSDPPLDSYPAGAVGSSVFIGITALLTGTYPADGKDAQLGYGLAMTKHRGGGAPAGKRGVSGKDALGRTTRYGISDSETKPNVAEPALAPVVVGKALSAVQDPDDFPAVMEIAPGGASPPITETGCYLPGNT